MTALRTLVTMVWLVPVLHVAVRVCGYPRTHAWLDRRAVKYNPAASRSADDVHTWRLATSRVARYSWLPGNCLSRSLALHHVLQARGFDVRLHLGVLRAGAALAGHAWVSHGDLVLNDTQDVASRYVPFTPRPLPPPH